MPDKIVVASRPDCCLCARSTSRRVGERCAHIEDHRYCDEHAARVAKIDICPMCNGLAKHTFLDEAMTIRARCAKPAIKGTTVCNDHGGRVGNTRRKAASRRREAQAIAAVEVLRQQRGWGDVSAIKLVQFCLNECAFWVCEWRDEVHRLSEGQPGRLIHENVEGDLSVHVAFACLTDWIDRSAKIAKTAIDIGLEERKQKLQEQQFDLMLKVMLAGFAEIGVDEATARPLIVRHLRSA